VHIPEQEFQIGDLVKCIYDLFNYYDYLFDYHPEHGYPFHGIVIGVQNNLTLEERVGYTKLYTVICFDGHTRFFTCWEMCLMSRSL